MGVEIANKTMAIQYDDDDEEQRYISDDEAFSSVIEVLDGVRKAPTMISQVHRDEYDNLVRIVEPNKKVDPDEEALLVVVVKALSGAVSKIDIDFHGSLLINIFDMSLWNYGLDARNALLELIISLAAVPHKFLDASLHMLVSNFLPPRRIRESISESRWLTKKKEIQSQLYMALRYIADLVPLAPVKLKDMIHRRMPRHTDPKEVIIVFVDCMLGLERDEIGEFLGSTLLAKVVDLLTDLDVNISWEDILLEDHTKGIFDMEFEDVQENVDGVGRIGTKPLEETEVFRGNDFAKKLDGLMVIMCEHLKTCANDGRLLEAFDTLMESFQKTVLNAYKSKFVQFVMFYACSLDPEQCGKKFTDLLMNIFVSKNDAPISRMSAVAYLASYLSRSKFISIFLVANILERLVNWCFEYCQFQNCRHISNNPQAHQIFYSGCQAVMYVLCFRMRSMVNIPELKSLLFHLPLQTFLYHPLDPLKVCLPTIVHEFLRQATVARLLDTSMNYHDNLVLESIFSKAYGGAERLDMFFPFDPYLLRESDRFMRPNFMFWSMVKTTYSDSSSEDEDGEDLDDPCVVDDVGSFEELGDSDNNHEGDDLEHPMNKMSITPKPTCIPHRMPAKLRPSVSPT